jgi:uncharacterized protein (TIGR00661 family)
MGHAMRSRVILEHLVAAGHELTIMASGRAQDFLGKRFAGVTKIHGFHMITEENRIHIGKTIWSNVLQGTAGVPKNIAAYFDLITSFRPTMVISDFESWAYLYARTHRLPLLSIDNMQIINRCTHGPDILADDRASFEVARAFVKSKLPFCDEYLITTFFYPPIRKEKTKLFPPILRPEILAGKKKARRGDHLLVYQTAEGNEALVLALAKSGVPCRIYGMRRTITEDEVEGNLTYRPFGEERFIEDMATSRAVIAGGGFTTMGEAVYLQKPMLSVPIAQQFEQVMNARYLEKEGYGRFARTLDEPGVVQSFLDAIPACEEKLAGYQQDGNTLILGALDEFLDKVEAGVA